jgi:hypothetical protein
MTEQLRYSVVHRIVNTNAVLVGWHTVTHYSYPTGRAKLLDGILSLSIAKLLAEEYHAIVLDQYGREISL